VNKKRLLKLADLLEADAANKKGMKFDLFEVAAPSNRHSKAPAVDCGTTGCAMGLAAVSGIFRKQGLTFRTTPKFWDEALWKLEMVMDGEVVAYDEAAQILFDIHSRVAGYLFDPDGYLPGSVPKGARGERRVAKRIRDLVERGDLPDHGV
jgi:hypothetical protein